MNAIYFMHTCIARIRKARNTQLSVLKVNIDSPRKYQVMIGNVTYEKTAAINLTLQSSPVASKQNLVPYQKARPAGVPKTIVARMGLLSQ